MCDSISSFELILPTLNFAQTVMNQEPISKLSDSKKFVILAFDGVTLLDVIGPAEVYDVAKKEVLQAKASTYQTIIASAKGAPVRSSSNIVINATDWDTIDPTTVDTIIVPGGGPPSDPPTPASVVSRLQEFAPHARRICSICTGTFILGAAGLLDGRKVTTHWQAAKRFEELFPEAQLDSDPIFVRDGEIWSSAGFTAGMDMALALMEEDEGYQTAVQLARLLVMFLKRSGGQSQFSLPLSVQTTGGEDFSDLHAWISENLKQKITVEQLAQKAGMAPRTFARRYLKKVGQTPAKMICNLRLEAACQLLAETGNSMQEIADKTGYVTEQNMRRSFMRSLGVSPIGYRQRFPARSLKVPAE